MRPNSADVSAARAETEQALARLRTEFIRNDPARRAAFWYRGLALAHQRPPGDRPWTTWLLLGGRGAGKTRAGAEWVRHLAEGPWSAFPFSARAIALVAESYSDAREIMIEGPSGVLATAAPGARPSWEPSRRRLVWETTGAVARCFSAEDPEGLRGYEFDAAWSDELCKWRYPEETWSNLQLALRLGDNPRQLVTTTPRPTALIKRLAAAEMTALVRASTFDNADNLSPAFFSEIAALYAGTALGRQELEGEIVDDVEGALWTWALIEAARIARAPALDRVIVAVDPPVSIGPKADECGVIVAGRAGETAYVLADRSVRGLSPRGWAERAVAAYHDYEADRVVVEANQGGEMAREVLRQIDPALPVSPVHATRSKRVRAEPVAALYERGLVRHAGAFPALEDQMTAFTGETGESPDRLDALVWALTALMIRPRTGAPTVRSF